MANIHIEDIPKGATIHLRQVKDTMYWNHKPPLSTKPYLNSYTYKGQKVFCNDGQWHLLNNFKIVNLGIQNSF